MIRCHRLTSRRTVTNREMHWLREHRVWCGVRWLYLWASVSDSEKRKDNT